MQCSGVGGNIVEVVASDKLSHERFIRVTKSAWSLLARSKRVGVNLTAEESRRSAIAHSRVGVDVESPSVLIYTHGR